MNTEEKRIEIRRFYVGKAALFGLLYGLFIGIIVGIILFVMILLGATKSLNVVGKEFQTIGIGMGLIVLVVMVVFYALASCVGFVVVTLIYNLIAKIGVRVHFGLAEYGETQLGVQKQVSSKVAGNTPGVVITK